MVAGTSLSDSGSTFSEIASTYGAALYCSTCNAAFTGSIMTNLVAYSGGSLYIVDSSTVNIDNV